MIEKAVELRPEDGYIVDSLGWAHYRLGDYASAVQYLEQRDRAGAGGPDDQRPSGRRLLADRPARPRRAINGGAPCSSGPQDDEIKPIEAKLDDGSRAPTAGAGARRLSAPSLPARLRRVFAPAKINLYLHVTGRRADGYHLLDSLVAFADIGDRVTAAPADALSLTVDGPEAAALAAARRRQSRAARRPAAWPRITGSRRGAALHLDKNLPVAVRHRRRVERRRGGAARARRAVAAAARGSRR